jgi:hypothetical protein
MHVLDQAVSRHHDSLVRRRLPDRRVVANPQFEVGAGSHLGRKRRSKKLDQAELSDVANTTLVSHPPASRISIVQ